MRKDAKCLYGILKRHFQLLNNTVQLNTQEDIDRVMWTCFILHNMSQKYNIMVDMVADLECAGADRSREHGGALAPGAEETVDSNLSATVVEKETGFVGFRNQLV